MSEERLVVWTIYEHPLDYPNHFAVRPWIGLKPGEVQLADTLENARKLIPPGLYNLGRDPEDDRIVEVWV